MGQREVPVAVDTYGLPEYQVSEIMYETEGDRVRMLCGIRRFGQITWLYTAVMQSDLLMVNSRKCHDIAREVFHEAERGPLDH